MSDGAKKPAAAGALTFEYELDAAPEMVWRALSDADIRARWLPQGDLAEAEAVLARPEREIRYRMRDAEPPYLESLVIFRITPIGEGRTRLAIIHAPDDRRLDDAWSAANDNGAQMAMAA